MLGGARCSRADPTITPVVHGKPLVHADGKVPVIHLSHLERVDARFIYVTDSGFGVIVVIDRETDEATEISSMWPPILQRPLGLDTRVDAVLRVRP